MLRQSANAPLDLAERAIELAGALLELAGAAHPGNGLASARSTLASGAAWRKFQAICEAQGGLRVPPVARWRHAIVADRSGRAVTIDNRRIARIAKLACAPESKAAGIVMHARLGNLVERGAALFTIHAESPGELAYSLDYATRVAAVQVSTEG